MQLKFEDGKKNYYILAAIHSWKKLDLDSRKDMRGHCKKLFKRLEQKAERNIHPKFLSLSHKTVISSIKDNSVIYIVGHGNPRTIGTEYTNVDIGPLVLSKKLVKANLSKERKITIKIFTCNSAVDEQNVEIWGNECDEFNGPTRTPQKYSFAQYFAMHLNKFGYYNLRIEGYIGFLAEQKFNSGKLHSMSDFNSADFYPGYDYSLSLRSKLTRLSFFSSKPQLNVYDNEEKIDFLRNHLNPDSAFSDIDESDQVKKRLKTEEDQTLDGVVTKKNSVNLV